MLCYRFVGRINLRCKTSLQVEEHVPTTLISASSSSSKSPPWWLWWLLGSRPCSKPRLWWLPSSCLTRLPGTRSLTTTITIQRLLRLPDALTRRLLTATAKLPAAETEPSPGSFLLEVKPKVGIWGSSPRLLRKNNSLVLYYETFSRKLTVG